MIEELLSKISIIWWSGKERGKYWAILSWKNLCQPKRMGVLVFMIFEIFLNEIKLTDFFKKK